MTEALTVFIGYDAREDEAYEVCRASLLKYARQPLHIVKLDCAPLKHAGWYRRDWYQEGKDRIDCGDGRPFSTDFAFTRFMVPALNLYQGWALFCDSDFLFTADIGKLFALADDRYAVMCVKHDHDPSETVKMDGISQGKYHRKNWSSLVLWNCGHPANAYLTGYMVNQQPGRFLHGFNWISTEKIGVLPKQWNWLAGVDDWPLASMPAGIHFTLGIPTMPGCENTPYADLWRAARASLATKQEQAA